MMKHVTESLVGRAGIIRMQGLSNDEIRNKHYPPFQVDLSSLMKRMNELEPMTLTQIFSEIFKGSMPRLYENENVDREQYYESDIFIGAEQLKTKIGEGAVICMASDLIPVDKKNWYIPAWLI